MTRFINPTPQFFDANGVPLVAGTLTVTNSNTTTPKSVFSDIAEAVEIANPVVLDAAGRAPNMFWTGSAKVVLKDTNGVQVWERDPIESFSGTGVGDWSAVTTYNIPDLVVGSDDRYYVSIADLNIGSDPTTPSPTKWTELVWAYAWNTNQAYLILDIVRGSDGNLYQAVQGNTGNDPIADTTGVNWAATLAPVIVADLNVQGTVIAEAIAGSSTTGVISGCILSANADTNTVDVTAGIGVILDYTDPQAPVVTQVTFDAVVAEAIDTPAAAATFFSIDSAGALQQSVLPPTRTETRSEIPLGAAAHPAGLPLLIVVSARQLAFDPGASLRDLSSSLSSVTLTGNEFTHQGSGLLTNKSAGQTFSLNSNATNVLDPNVTTDIAVTGVTLDYNYQDGIGGWTRVAAQTAIDPDQWDDADGTLGAVDTGKWTIQNIFYVASANVAVVHYGQRQYNNKENAVADIAAQKLLHNPGLSDTELRTSIIVQQGATDLSDTDQALFYHYNRSGVDPRPEADSPILTSSKTIPFTWAGRLAGTGVFYLGQTDYRAPVGAVALNQGSPTQTYGTATSPNSAHAFVVVSGVGTSDKTTGFVQLRVSGISITDTGVRNAADEEVLIVDIEAGEVVTDKYFETTKKWLGQITYTLENDATGDAVNFALTFNYGFCKYDDAGNKNFTLAEIEFGGICLVNDAGFDIEVIHHRDTGWTYDNGAFVPGPAADESFVGTLLTDSDLQSGEKFFWKLVGLTTSILGNDGEGVVVRMTIGANNSVQVMDGKVGITI